MFSLYCYRIFPYVCAAESDAIWTNRLWMKHLNDNQKTNKQNSIRPKKMLQTFLMHNQTNIHNACVRAWICFKCIVTRVLYIWIKKKKTSHRPAMWLQSLTPIPNIDYELYWPCIPWTFCWNWMEWILRNQQLPPDRERINKTDFDIFAHTHTLTWCVRYLAFIFYWFFCFECTTHHHHHNSM